MQEVNQEKEQLCLNDSLLSSESRLESDNDTSEAKGIPETIVPKSSDADLEVTKNPEKAHVIRLAHLNKPEIPILLVGAVVATVSGSVLPVDRKSVV